ncbi:FAD-dependent oxidoreductase [Clostridium sp. SHJSY1]|uniref:NAD(P)/FAD-dependent oxidoreductase n=1 Tax=Clostridium sp. SHJSY1 TaxID=2942483 RepID=UPI0028745EAE|nr:FAD-dependent oxidoreductase [Clostridium sp. SHJSY1]MDS0528128.1 FAD-dependent oxidoreductase [Clostridium sp. SHJSY1]
MDYDVLILGGGIIGCSVAYEMSKYNLNIALIEKDYDIADDISFVNTSVVYDGSETSDAVMASLENIGSRLIEKACSKFKVPYKRIGALRVADNIESIERLEKMYERAKERKIDNVLLINREDALEIEKNLKIDVEKALYSKNVAITAPYDLAIAYAEVAAENGVNFRFEEEVIEISNINKGFKVTTNKNKFTCKVVIDTIANEMYIGENYVKKSYLVEDNEDSKNMSYYLMDDNMDKQLDKIIIKDLDEKTFVLNIPNLSGGYIIGIKNPRAVNIDDGIDYANMLIPGINKSNVSNIFSDLYKKDSMNIDDKYLEFGYIRVTGTHYGKITLSPAIAQSISISIASNLKASEKKDFVDKRREIYRFRDMNNQERNELIALDSRYGNIVCVCNEITEGEIIDSIRRPLGARTVQGVKRRTGAALGNCHGSYCVRKIINVLARELDMRATDIVEDSEDSSVWVSRIKEFDEV